MFSAPNYHDRGGESSKKKKRRGHFLSCLYARSASVRHSGALRTAAIGPPIVLAAAAGAQKVASVRRASVGFLSVFFGFWGRVSFDLDTNGVGTRRGGGG